MGASFVGNVCRSQRHSRTCGVCIGDDAPSLHRVKLWVKVWLMSSSLSKSAHHENRLDIARCRRSTF